MPSKKTVRQREVRLTKSKERHFNMPLRHFIEHKYPDIFEEYRDLYNQMVINHPKRINLMKSKTFKKWLKSIESTNNHTPEDLSTETTDQNLSVEAPAVVVQAQETDQNLPVEAPAVVVQAQETDQNLPVEVPTVAVQETGEDIFPNDLEAQIDGIMNELLQDELIRGVLDPGNDIELDEGIELNILDEIYQDIEPFDYDLEVELYDM